MPGKALVLDANILVRAVLGRRVRDLIEDYSEDVTFFVPRTAYAEAEEHLAAALVIGCPIWITTIFSDAAWRPGPPTASKCYCGNDREKREAKRELRKPPALPPAPSQPSPTSPLIPRPIIDTHTGCR